MYKIVAISNFNDETQSDRLVADNIKSQYEAEIIAKALNKNTGNNSRDYYKIFPADYELYYWEP